MKMNKKGFTLIEMLVVIAIIAVLVAIIIPTVSSATNKAGAAANAANLRSVYAELQTDLLSAGANTEGYVHIDADGEITLHGAPASAKTVGIEKGEDMVYNTTNKTVTYGTLADGTLLDIAYFADIAEDGKVGS